MDKKLCDGCMKEKENITYVNVKDFNQPIFLCEDCIKKIKIKQL